MSTAAHPSEPLSARQVPLPTAAQLPDHPDTLKNMIVELVATLRQRDHDLEEARQRVHLLLQRLYGRRSERFNPDQPLLFSADEAATAAASTSAAAQEAQADPEPEPAKSRKRCRPHGRRRLPEDLPRRELHHELSDAERICVCGQTRIDIGTDNGGEQLDWQPACYFVWQHWIHKYLCRHCAGQGPEARMATAHQPTPATTRAEQAAAPAAAMGAAAAVEPAADSSEATAEQARQEQAPPAIGPVIIAAAKPPMPINKGLPGPGLLAHIIVSKYFDHLPLYRQENISRRHGLFIARSTSCDWMAACAELLRPLYDVMVANVLQSLWLHTDDTPVKNLDHEPGTTDKARFWIYYGDRSHPYNVFDFTVNRKRDGPQQFLGSYLGYLHADAFSGYDGLYLPTTSSGTTRIHEVACNAHARRKFYEARTSDALRAHQALGYYRQLYALERPASDFAEEQRWQMRQEFALPILEQFHTWLEAQRAEVLPKSPMGEAISYALNNWSALIRYTRFRQCLFANSFFIRA